MTLSAALALAAITLTATPSWANTTSGMIDGNYSAQMRAYTYMRDSSGYTDVCVQIVGSGGTATGTIKGRRHNGTWESLLDSAVTLSLLSGASGRGINQGTPGTPEACTFGFASRPTNWCGQRRQFDEQGWAGHLTHTQRLRAKVNNHILEMQGERFLTHGTTCP